MFRRTEQDPRSKTLPRAVLVLVQAAVLVALLTRSADAQPAGSPDAGVVNVIEVSGLLDRVLVDFVDTQIASAEAEGALSLVLQLNSAGAVVSDERLDELVAQVKAASVPVDVWVGPSGSQASGEATALVAAARTVGIAPGSRVEVTRTLLGDQELDGDAAVGDKVSAGDAVDLGLADNAAPTIGAFLLGLDGFESRPGEAGGREPVTQARFGQLPLISQLMHTVASPPVAYLLFVIGLALIVFELFTAGVGVAGVVGSGALVLGSYGLAALPTNPLGIALLLFAMFAFAVDVQTGVPRVWSAIGVICFTAGSVGLYQGLSLSWLTLLVAIVGMGLAMIGGMPSMVRTRFSTPTIGREWMVGEIGAAVGPVAPDGVVTIRDAPWRARTNRATPIEAAAAVRVVSIDGLVLEVEPVEGAALDNQDRTH